MTAGTRRVLLFPHWDLRGQHQRKLTFFGSCDERLTSAPEFFESSIADDWRAELRPCLQPTRKNEPHSGTFSTIDGFARFWGRRRAIRSCRQKQKRSNRWTCALLWRPTLPGWCSPHLSKIAQSSVCSESGIRISTR